MMMRLLSLTNLARASTTKTKPYKRIRGQNIIILDDDDDDVDFSFRRTQDDDAIIACAPRFNHEPKARKQAKKSYS